MPSVMPRNGLVRHRFGLVNTEHDFRHENPSCPPRRLSPVLPVLPTGSGIEGGSAQTETPFRAQNAQNGTLQPAVARSLPVHPRWHGGWLLCPVGLGPVSATTGACG